MVNFGPRDTVPDEFRDRKFYQHNPNVTLMRTNVDESAKLGEVIGRKVAASTGPAALMLPLQGVSAIDHSGQAFDDPEAREALYGAIRENHGTVALVEIDQHINDPDFADAAAKKLLELMQQIG